jgi:hypothetical protein
VMQRLCCALGSRKGLDQTVVVARAMNVYLAEIPP